MSIEEEVLTVEELGKLTINPSAAREACNQAEKRLADIIATSAGYETKAGALFSVYITIALATLGGSGAFLGIRDKVSLVISLGLTGVVFVVGALFLAMVFRARMFGFLGSDPEVWLHADVLEGTEQTIGYNLAFITRDYVDRIRRSEATNDIKQWWIEAAIWVGVSGPAVFAIAMLISTYG
jgi:hypothetical protein